MNRGLALKSTATTQSSFKAMPENLLKFYILEFSLSISEIIVGLMQ